MCPFGKNTPSRPANNLKRVDEEYYKPKSKKKQDTAQSWGRSGSVDRKKRLSETSLENSRARKLTESTNFKTLEVYESAHLESVFESFALHFMQLLFKAKLPLGLENAYLVKINRGFTHFYSSIVLLFIF